MRTREELEKKLEELRKKYLAAETDVDRKIITAQGKLIKWALEKKKKDIYEEAKEIFK